MRTSILLGLAAFLVGVLADEVSNEAVKAAYIDALKQAKVIPRIIEGYQNTWDGSLPETLGELKTLLQRAGHPEEEVTTILDGMATVAKNKDNPSWKTHYGNLFIRVGGVDKSVVEKFEEAAPDSIPSDINVAKEALKNSGLHPEHAAGHAKIAVWLGKLHA